MNTNKEYKFDAGGQILGRLATQVAVVLRGKDSAAFSPNNPDLTRTVVVFNTDKLKFTGHKLEDKKYFRHSGYPGGISQRTLGERLAKDSRGVLRDAVYGMLPKNRLRDKFIRNLKIYKGEIK
ncbi:MAG: 50S ribosomal protein L13 [Minisyncoccia bacterium]